MAREESSQQNHTETFGTFGLEMVAGYCAQDLEAAGYHAIVNTTHTDFGNQHSVLIDADAIDSARQALRGRWS